MKRLAPGVYDDERGGLHLDLTELLTANGWADTPENREALIAAAREAHGDVTVTSAPLSVFTDPPYVQPPFLVWSFEHDAWWRPGRMGYTKDVAAAGHYGLTEATEIVINANLYSQKRKETLAFQCPRCAAVSFNLNDIREQYCGACHNFVSP